MFSITDSKEIEFMHILPKPTLLDPLFGPMPRLGNLHVREGRVGQKPVCRQGARFPVGREQRLLVQWEIDNGMAKTEDYRLDQGLALAETR
jgi:hypothetical protein